MIFDVDRTVDASHKHKGFSKLVFTGFTEVGYEVARETANKLIPAALELLRIYL
ncbi:hypothetical protein CLOSBL3_11405 [Clostridiaceae bacterium BL-3]|nr:hypothetical protein CLOSBL3_11405 [Clostridiaceae bacterium BL-3]